MIIHTSLKENSEHIIYYFILTYDKIFLCTDFFMKLFSKDTYLIIIPTPNLKTIRKKYTRKTIFCTQRISIINSAPDLLHISLEYNQKYKNAKTGARTHNLHVLGLLSCIATPKNMYV